MALDVDWFCPRVCFAYRAKATFRLMNSVRKCFPFPVALFVAFRLGWCGDRTLATRLVFASLPCLACLACRACPACRGVPHCCGDDIFVCFPPCRVTPSLEAIFLGDLFLTTLRPHCYRMTPPHFDSIWHPGLVAGMQAGKSLVNMLTPMAFEVALMTASWLAHVEASMVAPMASMVAPMASMVASMASMASMVASMAPMVASMASLASMVETLDWWKQMTAESRNDGERVDGWTHKIRKGRVDGLIKRFVHERADGLTHKIREEPTAGWTLFVDMVQVVTWARMKRRASLVDSTAASMASIASVASMATLMVTMMALMVSSRSKETTAKGDREGHKGKCQNGA